MATTKYTGYTSSNLPATVTTTPDYASKIPKEDLASFQKANPGLTFGAQDYAQYNKAVSPTIDATKIGTTATTPVPPPTEPAINPNQATQIANYTASSATDATNAEVQQAQIEAEAQKARAQTMVTDYAQSQALLGNKSSDLIASRNIKDELGKSINDKAAVLRQLDAQAQGLQNEASAIPIQVQQESLGRGRTAAGIAPIQASRLRENALKALSLGQQAAIAKADYDTAKSYADQIVEAKYSGMEADLASKKTQLEWAMQQDLAPAQKKLADAQARKIEKDKQDLVEKRESEKMASEMIINARGQGAPQNIADKAQKILEEGGSKLDVARALGVYGGDFLRNELTREQLKQARAERVASTVSGGGVSFGGMGDTPSTSAAKNWLAQYNSGALELGDIYTKIGSSKEASLIKNELAGLVAAQGGKRVYGMDDATIEAINSQIKNVDDLLTGGVGKIVGVVQGGLGIFPDRLNVGKQDALAIAKNLTSNQTLQALADAKSKGITFGALSEKELSTVAESASRIAAKLKTDKEGNIVGFSGSEGQFIKDLEEIKKGLQKAIAGKTGTKIVVPQGVSTAGASYAQSSMSVIGNVNNQVNTQQSYSGYDTGIK